MSCCKKRVFVTGATGLIGRETIPQLFSRGFEVFALTRGCGSFVHPLVKWIPGDVFDVRAVSEIVGEVRPTHLLNLAWTTTGDYLSSNLNYRFLSAGIGLADAFAAVGGKRAVYAGSCLEYERSDSPLTEESPINPNKTEYTFCKNLLRQSVERQFLRKGVEFAYGRIFYVYGKYEAKTRLTGMILDKLTKDETVEIRTGNLRKDYMYSKDIAAAFAALLDKTGVTGSVNICTGRAISVKDYALCLARELGKPGLINVHNEETTQPPLVLGDNTRLVKEVGFRCRYELDAAIHEICSGT